MQRAGSQADPLNEVIPNDVAAAYWFTASTWFANPAVAIARSLSNTFSGLRPQGLPGFVAAELAGALLALVLMNWLLGAGEGAAMKGGRQAVTVTIHTIRPAAPRPMPW